MSHLMKILAFNVVVVCCSLTYGQQADERVTYIPIEARGVDCSQLFDAVSSDLHWVAGSVTAFTRAFGLEAEGKQYLTKAQVDELIMRFPDTFAYRDDPTTGKPSVAVNVGRLASVLSDKKSKFRQWLSTASEQPLASLEKIEKTWKAVDRAPNRVVVVLAGLHGVESTSEVFGEEIFSRTSLPVCSFAYPNDAPVAESAGLLVMHLQDFHRDFPTTHVTLVTHSMGGLVARAAMELDTSVARPSFLQRTGVDQLIQICPPNHGSALAEYGPLLEGAEQFYRIVHRKEERQRLGVLRTVVDGFNEASADLSPDSRFLARLNAQERNADVDYTILAGNDGPLRPVLGGLIGSLWSRVAAEVDGPGEIDRRVQEVLTCAELQNGKGDGVVSVESARLAGVSDFLVLLMHHLVWNEPESDVGKQMLDEVASRIGTAL